MQRRIEYVWSRMTPVQRIVFPALAAVAFVLGVLFLVFHERILIAIAPLAGRWRHLRGGWAILWAATFVVGFPPLIGYSLCVALAGFVFGLWKG